LYNYDTNNNQTEQLQQTWADSAWINEYKISYSYSPVTVIDDNLILVNMYRLSNNYPNPFNPTTKINYQIPELSFITIKVYDVLGRYLASLVKEEKPAGSYTVEFSANGGSTSGGDTYNLSSGIYFYRLEAGSFVETKKMILLK
jgi:hypothetical protein